MCIRDRGMRSQFRECDLSSENATQLLPVQGMQSQFRECDLSSGNAISVQRMPHSSCLPPADLSLHFLLTAHSPFSVPHSFFFPTIAHSQ
eukprot:2748658-Rhodomonas_salina.1